MRVKQMTKVHNLRHEIEEDFPGTEYVAKTINNNGVKGRFLGYDLGQGLQVGVFSQTHSNLAHILVRGYDEKRTKEIDNIKSRLHGLGFTDL